MNCALAKNLSPSCGLSRSGKSQKKLYFIQAQGNVRDFVSGQGICKSLFKVSEKSGEFYPKIAANYFVTCFCIAKAIFFQEYLSHPYFCGFVARIIILHGQ